jgi:Cellulase (glycosyl hydrolase family 5)
MDTGTESPVEIALHRSFATEARITYEQSCRVCRVILLLLCALAVEILNGCGGSNSTSTPNPNPVPTVSSVTPASGFAGDAAFTLTVTGANFVTSSMVQWNGSPRTTTFVASSSLQAAITATDVATPSTATVTVSTPAPGGGASGPVNFTIKVPVPNVAISPTSGKVAAGGQLQFQATVTKTQNTAVTWLVNNIAGGNAAVGTISNSGLYIAPIAAMTVTVSAVSQADTNQSAAADLSVLAPHPIGVRPAAAIAEFFDRNTGNVFVPRGNNYIRLAAQTFPDGSSHSYHSTFNVGLYDSNGVEAAMTNMQTNGYNIARVFVNGCCQNNTLGNPAGGLSSPYLANVIDFLQRAKTHGIWVILEADSVPAVGGYTQIYAGCTNFSDWNTYNLCVGGVKAITTFFHDIVQGLINGNAPLDAIFAYELRNEYYYASDSPPLSWTTGTVTTADGQTYDMSSATSRQQMMDNGLVYFTDQVRAAILELDPTALVEVGFFVPQGPNPTRIGDPRVITVYPAMANSTADFVSVHPYPFVGGLTFAQYAQNFGFVGYQQQKPVVLEEFGVLESDYPAESTAASVAHDWQIQSCAYGIKGWAFWTWDTSNSEQVDGPFWPASLGAGLISQTLSPVARPDPCAN